MRLAVIADIHGNLLALEAVLADIAANGAPDKLWVLGDLALRGSRPAECLSLLQALPTGLPKAEFIGGNTDRYLATSQRPTRRPKDAEAWASLPNELLHVERIIAWTIAKLSFADYQMLASITGRGLDLRVPNYGWLVGYHGTPGDDEGIMLPDTASEDVLDFLYDQEGNLAIGGHTHKQMDRQVGRWRVLNPGSVGLSDDGPYACYALLNFAKDGNLTVTQQRVPYDTEAAIADLAQTGYPDAAPTGQWLRDGHRPVS
jgi:predicted phosphodiesterase